MKKFISQLVSLMLAFALVCSFSACTWEATSGTTDGSGSGENTQTEEDAAAKEAENLALALEALNERLVYVNRCIVEEGEEDYYTKESAKEFLDSLAEAGFDADATIEGKNSTEVYAIATQLNDLIKKANFVTMDSFIDARLQNALTSKLTLRNYSANGDYYTLDSKVGVDIEYLNDTNAATFYVPTETMNAELKTFTQSNVLDVFMKDFSDVYAVSMTIMVAKDPENPSIKTEETVSMKDLNSSNTSANGGIILAASLLACIMGYEQEFYDAYITGDATKLYNALQPLLGTGKGATYGKITGKSKSATVTFKNVDEENPLKSYEYTTEFMISFVASEYSVNDFFVAPNVPVNEQ